jgi:hypothetical protein
VIRRLDSIEQRLEILGASVTSINIQPFTKGLIDLGSLVGQVTRAQQMSTDRHFDLETRIAKLEQQVAKLTPAA